MADNHAIPRASTNILPSEQPPAKRIRSAESARILIVRTDRIGDVLLSTPVIAAVRKAYPSAYIAMMVSPVARDIIDGNPYLDEVVIYDKDVGHRSWWHSWRFARALRRKRFNLALILHPTNRVHLVTYASGIPRRIGYNRKFGFLLTDRIKHAKHLGERHERDYNLDLARFIGVPTLDDNLYMPIRASSEQWVAELFCRQGISEGMPLVALHPGASCPSKIWPHERFAQVADALSRQYGCTTIVVAGPADRGLSERVVRAMRSPVINLAGQTSLSQLASVLKRCRLFVSNDSGPVHLACAVGVPVVAIFGRNQPGLSPLRWKPLGERDRILHKDVGCIECYAHNCAKGFKCLSAVTVGEVVAAAQGIWEGDRC
jgi:lipopolysaccharide heptosyltransferase II